MTCVCMYLPHFASSLIALIKKIILSSSFSFLCMNGDPCNDYVTSQFAHYRYHKLVEEIRIAKKEFASGLIYRMLAIKESDFRFILLFAINFRTNNR